MMRNRLETGFNLGVAVAVIVGLGFWFLPGNEQTVHSNVLSGKGALAGAGSSFSSVLFKSWFDRYQHQYPDIAISYDPAGSGEGVRRFIGKNVKREEAVDFAASDAAMQDEEIAQVDQGVLMLPITAGGIVLAYNLPGMDGELKLSREAYAGIFLGKITKWNDPRIVATNPGLALPRQDIVTVVRQDSSGTTFAFTKHLDSISSEWHSRIGASKLVNWPGTAMRASGNEGVAGKIKQAVGSIGYVGYEFSRQLDLKTASLENKDGKFVRPSERAFNTALASAELPENLRGFVPDPAGAESYPIVTFSWVLVRRNNSDAAKVKLLRELLTWCLLDGQHYSSELGYVPLPASVTRKTLESLAGMRPQQ